jgi:hypothetical protein
LLQPYGRILAMASSDSPSDGDREVFASLPNSRPTRRSAKRDRPGRGRGAGAAAEGPAAAGAAPAKKAKAEPGGARATTKPGAARATAKRGAARATTKPGAARATAKPGAARASAKREAAPKAAPIPPAGYATPRGDGGAPGAPDVVSTAVQAAGELAQIAIAVGGRALKSALQRLPRP